MFPDVCWIWWLVGRCQEQESRISTLGPKFWKNSGYLETYICILQTNFNQKWILVPSWWGQLLSVFSRSVVNIMFFILPVFAPIQTPATTIYQVQAEDKYHWCKNIRDFWKPWSPPTRKMEHFSIKLLWFKYWCSSRYFIPWLFEWHTLVSHSLLKGWMFHWVP